MNYFIKFIRENIFVNIGFLISIFFIISSVYIFDDFNEIFKGGAMLYDNIIFNLSLSYIGGWIIWILTSIIPLYNDRKKMENYENFLLQKVLNNGKTIINSIIKYDNTLTLEKIKEACLAFKLYGKLEHVKIMDNNSNFIDEYSNFDYLYDNIHKLRLIIKEVINEYKYIDTGVLVIITNIIQINTFNSSFDLTLNIYKNRKVKNTNLEHFGEDFYELYLQIKALEKHIKAINKQK